MWAGAGGQVATVVRVGLIKVPFEQRHGGE